MKNICRMCFRTNDEAWLIKDPTERLTFLTMAIILKRSRQELAVVQFKERDFASCPEHFDQFSKKMIEMFEMRDDGTLNPLGVRIFEVLASSVLGKRIVAGSMDEALSIFIGKYNTRGSELMKNRGIKVGGSYAPPQQTDKKILVCMQCGQEQLEDTAFTLTRWHEKVSFGIYCGALFANILNDLQAYTVAILSEVVICKSHQMAHAWQLKELEFKLLDEANANEFSRMIGECYEKGWMDILKCVNCYAYNVDKCEFQKEKCKFCKKVEDNVFYDRLLGCHAHWACFQHRAADIQWDLRTVINDYGYPKIRVPRPEDFEFAKGAELERMLYSMRKFFGTKDMSRDHERVICLAFFARYWKPDNKMEQKVNDLITSLVGDLVKPPAKQESSECVCSGTSEDVQMEQ